jgi:hypothetical protein
MVEKVKKHLNEYLEFDSGLIFNNPLIVAGDGDKINDIDMVGMSRSVYKTYEILIDNGFKKIDLVKPDIYNIYKDIKFIFDPITLMNNNQKIVQLIRPSQVHIQQPKWDGVGTMRYSYFRLLKNVDLSSSGLFYDGEKIYESVKDAYTHCKAKVFEQCPDAMMYNINRTYERRRKLVDNKWFEIVKDGNVKTTSYLLATRRLKFHSIQRYNIPPIEDYIEKLRYIEPFKIKNINPLQ